MNPLKLCLSFAMEVCVTYSFEIPIWELLITVLLTAAVTAITILWSVRVARQETIRVLREDRRAEARARGVREREAAEERARAEHRERLQLAAELLPIAEAVARAQRKGTKTAARKEADDMWNSISNKFELSPLADARKLYEWADHRRRHAESSAASATTAADFVSAHLYIEDVRRAVHLWVDTGRLSDAVSAEFEKFDAEARASLKTRVDALFQSVVDADRGNA